MSQAGGRDGVDDFVMLLSESQARALVAVPEGAVPAVFAAAEAEGVPVVRLGTTGGGMLAVTGADLLADLGNGSGWMADLEELRALSESALRERF